MNSFQFLFDLPEYQFSRHTQQAAGGLWRQGVMSKTLLASQYLVSRFALEMMEKFSSKDQT
ncbi:MAG: hypothetical protein ABIT06_01855 [Saprospiraceae bacterium]